jgi:hypothetical protein
MSTNMGDHNFGGVIRIFSDGKLGGMACVGGKALRTFDVDRHLSENQFTKDGKLITKDELITFHGMRVMVTYAEREEPGADIEKLSGWARGDAHAVSVLRGTPFWMMLVKLEQNDIEFSTLTKNQYIDYCHMFDREMLRETPFE